MVDQEADKPQMETNGQEEKASALEVRESDKFKYGDLILIYENKETIKCLTLIKGGVFQNKFGAFSHDDIVGKPFGSKIISPKTKGFITALRFIPYLWERSISRLTQILFNPDISMILTMLNITKNSIIYESGRIMINPRNW